MSKKALIIDDSRTAFLVLSRMLKNYQIIANHADSGDVGLEMLKQESYDVVFLDQSMPGKSGTETIAEIKAAPELSNIPVLMFTARTGLDYKKQVRALGAEGVLPKELNHEEIEKALSKIHLWDPATKAEIKIRERRQPSADEKLRVWLESFLENEFTPELSNKVKAATNDLRRDTIHYGKRMLNELANTDKQQAMLKEVSGQTDYLKMLFQNSFRQFRLVSLLFAIGLLSLAGLMGWNLFKEKEKENKLDSLTIQMETIKRQNEELARNFEQQADLAQYQQENIINDYENDELVSPYSLVGLDPSGKYLVAKSTQGYLFMVNDTGTINNDSINYYYLDASCASSAYVDLISGLVARSSGELYFTAKENNIESMVPLSFKVDGGRCQNYSGESRDLKLLLPNDPNITEVEDIYYQLN